MPSGNPREGPCRRATRFAPADNPSQANRSDRSRSIPCLAPPCIPTFRKGRPTGNDPHLPVFIRGKAQMARGANEGRTILKGAKPGKRQGGMRKTQLFCRVPRYSHSNLAGKNGCVNLIPYQAAAWLHSVVSECCVGPGICASIPGPGLVPFQGCVLARVPAPPFNLTPNQTRRLGTSLGSEPHLGGCTKGLRSPLIHSTQFFLEISRLTLFKAA